MARHVFRATHSRRDRDLDQVVRLRAHLERQLHASRVRTARPPGPEPQRYDESGFPIRQDPRRFTERLRRLLA